MFEAWNPNTVTILVTKKIRNELTNMVLTIMDAFLASLYAIHSCEGCSINHRCVNNWGRMVDSSCSLAKGLCSLAYSCIRMDVTGN